MKAVALAALLAAVAAGCGGDEQAAPVAPPPAASTTTTGCRDIEQPAPKPERAFQAPSALLSAGRTYRAEVRTSCGAFTITLDPKAAPRAAASFVALARADYFDGTTFHRIVPGFVIQGGDPTGTGSGGPGYSTVDTPPAGTSYTKGAVAMAKTAAEAPGTAGSQFFVVTAADAGLPPDYAVVGEVTGGLETVARIAVLGDPGTELPTQPVVVEDVRILESE